MNFFKLTVVLLVLSMSIYVHAQVTKSVSDTIIKKSVLPEIRLNTDSMILNLNKEINTLKEKERELIGANVAKDQEIISRDAEIKRLKKHLIFADSIIARLSNDCLRKKFDSVRVAEALVYFSKMYSPELQSRFSPLAKLLKQYSNYSKEFSDILVEAEKDSDIKNPFTGQKKALSYIDKIKSTRYYQEAYSANWTIPYLNLVFDRIIKELKAFDPKASREIKLLDKMN